MIGVVFLDGVGDVPASTRTTMDNEAGAPCARPVSARPASTTLLVGQKADQAAKAEGRDKTQERSPVQSSGHACLPAQY